MVEACCAPEARLPFAQGAHHPRRVARRPGRLHLADAPRRALRGSRGRGRARAGRM